MRRLALLLAVTMSHAAARLDVEERIETTLSRKSAESGWVQSILAQALGEIQQACGSVMTAVPPTQAALRFRAIAHQFLRPSGRNTIDVQFLDCARKISAVTLGAIIVVDTSWLAHATDEDLWAVAAHEMAHRPSDFARRVVIGLHVPGLDAAAKDNLVTEIEMRADAGAVLLLTTARRNPTTLRRFLEAENRRAPSIHLNRRLAAL